LSVSSPQLVDFLVGNVIVPPS